MTNSDTKKFTNPSFLRTHYPLVADIRKGGRHAAICNQFYFRALISKDFSETGQCNYYMTEDKFLKTKMAIAAFPVDIVSVDIGWSIVGWPQSASPALGVRRMLQSSGNGEKLSSGQAEPGQAIKSAAACCLVPLHHFLFDILHVRTPRE